MKAAGAHAVRVDAYETRPGATQEQCAAERQLLAEGHIYAVAFTSTAEVAISTQGLYAFPLGSHRVKHPFDS